MVTMLATDNRGRATLGAKNATYKVTELEGGSMLLEPARVVTEVELAMLNTPGMLARIDAAMENPAAARVVKRRSPRA